MNRSYAFVLVLASLMILSSATIKPAYASADSWASKAPMHHARGYLGVAVVNGKIYAVGGDEGAVTGSVTPGTVRTSQVVNMTEAYDPYLDRWTLKAPMPTSRAQFGTAVYQNKIFCIGGYNVARIFVGPGEYDYKTEHYATGANEVYDPATDTWQIKTSAPTARYAAATNIVDGKIYVIGGGNMIGLWRTKLTEVYDPETDAWATKTPAPLNVSSSTSAVVDGKIYVLGESPDSIGSNVIQIYDPANDSWSIGASSPVSYSATSGATTGVNAPKRIYFFNDNRTDVYDPATDSWTVGTPSPTPRLIARVAVVDDMLYVIGGRTGRWGVITLAYPTTLNEQYTPIGYVTPDPTYQTPTPSTSAPSPTLNPTPSPSPPPTTQPQTSSPSNSQQPTISPENKTAGLQMELLYAAATAITIIVALAAIAVLLRRRK